MSVQTPTAYHTDQQPDPSLYHHEDLNRSKTPAAHTSATQNEYNPGGDFENPSARHFGQGSHVQEPASPRTIAAWLARPNRAARPPSTIVEQDQPIPGGLGEDSGVADSFNVPPRTSSRNQRRQNYNRSHREMDSAQSSDSPSERSQGRSHQISVSSMTSIDNYDAPLQLRGQVDEADKMDPITDDDPRSYDLVEAAPEDAPQQRFSLESQSERLFSHEHLKMIFAIPALFLKFTKFLSTFRPQSVPILIYYLDAAKALKAIKYANAVAEALEGIDSHAFTSTSPPPTANKVLEEKANTAFSAMVEQDLPAYVTWTYIQIVSSSITTRITGTMAMQLQEASEGLAEVFCLTDPSRPDNPIVFASEEFHRTTQYGTNYAIGRNCRFLQGPVTNKHSVTRLRDSVKQGRDHSEVFLNYRRDGSPFMNLLMSAPLCDSRGRVRYFIGAQVDVSGIVKDNVGFDALKKLERIQNGLSAEEEGETPTDSQNKDEFQELSEMLNLEELETVRKFGGRMHKEVEESDADSIRAPTRPRLVLKEDSRYGPRAAIETATINGKLSGVYQNYLLVRPYPALRILFASPSLRVPGILQSPFMNKIGGSAHVRDEITRAMAEGRGVTARIRWISRNDDEGRHRWIHCTPLTGVSGSVGVWMIVIVDDEKDRRRQGRLAPPVDVQARSKSVDRAMSIRQQGARSQMDKLAPPVPSKANGRVARLEQLSSGNLRSGAHSPVSPMRDGFGAPVKRYRDPAARSVRSQQSDGHSLDSLAL